MTMQLLYTFITALVISLILGKIGIPMLRSLHAQQSIREEGPKAHLSKAGTPTMGGIFILLALIVSVLIFSPWNTSTWVLIFLTIGHGLLGFSDDFIKSVKKRNLGLTAKQKLLGQIIMSAIFCYIATEVMTVSTALWIPIVNTTVDLGFFYYVLVFIIIVGTTNAVNLTDGLDGLAAGTSAAAAIAYTVIGMILYPENGAGAGVSFFSIALCGAVLGFLYYNSNPAKVFMGDTGSLALGGAFAGMAILTKTELLLILIGGVFVMEALSVIIQVVSFKTRGVRVFKMSPIHHHFELSGWSEQKVVVRFWLASCLCAVLGLLVFAIR
ncbi:MAG: phospho-N-acetylmuramoyl-pentapeptide-transferase [Veillonella sp.]|uniref:phospho-N-acetylmuramoyl-pentapeptide- transferase n=1 Tax=Veillonella sp. TaxID=1926307 RepID=UPI0025F1456D|nr:phospho-N-acetylmuramoyl-pentapeptide-transferase [Veillonella sp.]MBS4913749.1 phospho-N-acetylmuramoyl-pentapeptide-transferase [Veillonella sp.]